jgi:hypothetical protein
MLMLPRSSFTLSPHDSRLQARLGYLSARRRLFLQRKRLQCQTVVNAATLRVWRQRAAALRRRFVRVRVVCPYLSTFSVEPEQGRAPKGFSDGRSVRHRVIDRTAIELDLIGRAPQKVKKPNSRESGDQRTFSTPGRFSVYVVIPPSDRATNTARARVRAPVSTAAAMSREFGAQAHQRAHRCLCRDWSRHSSRDRSKLRSPRTAHEIASVR